MLEREILGCLLKDNALIHETIIQTEWFTDKGNRQLFDVMRKLSPEDKTVDKVTLLTETYGSIDINLINNIETIGNVENFESYEKQFIEKYKKEKAESITKHWLSDKQRQTSTLTEKLQQLEELGITDEQDKNTILMNLLEQLHSDEPVNTGVKTGLTELDNYLGGFQKTNSYIMGARPAMGKSATMLKFALSALEQGVVPIIFSIEMSKEGLLRRLISTVAHINSFYSRNPQNLTDSQKENYTKAVNELYKQDFEIFDAPVQTIAYMR